MGTISSMLLGAVFVKSPVILPPVGATYRPLLPSSEEESRPLTPSTASSGGNSPSESDGEERERRERKDREIVERSLDINGWELVGKGDFWCLFGIMGLLSGTGLMCMPFLPSELCISSKVLMNYLHFSSRHQQYRNSGSHTRALRI